jgi:hypothetical protein
VAEPGSPRTTRWLAAVAAVAAAGVVAGCATVPSGDQPQQISTGSSQIQAYVQPLPPPGPKQDWTPTQVVLGFLHASASYAFDPAAARQYLAPPLSRNWNPGPVTVVSSVEQPTQLPYHPQVALPAPAGPERSVEFTGQRLATLSQTGQYQYSPGTSTYQFILTQVQGVWLISTLPLGGQSLLLTQSDFEQVFQPRNLFFFAPPNSWAVNGELVPDPVYAPLQSADSALNTNLAAGLVRGLLTDRGSWLSGATTTAFPHGTKLLGITFSGQTAIVNLGGAAAHTSPSAHQAMREQLLATLGSKAYSTPLAHNVDLEIDGKMQFSGGNGLLVYEVQSGSLVYQAGPGQVNQLSSSRSLVTQAQVGAGPISALAATQATAQSPSQVAVAAENGAGCTLYVPAPGSSPAQYRSYPLSASGGPCTSLSWDANGNVWAVAGQHIWVLGAGTRQPVTVSGPQNLQPAGSGGASVLALQMAPDGVRAALLVRTADGNRLMLAAVTSSHGVKSLGTAVTVGTSLSGPIALSWYSSYDLLALTRTGIWEVPLTGGAAKSLGPAPAGAVSLASDGSSLAVGTSHGEILMPSDGGSPWSKVATGSIPAYSS